MGAAPTKLMSAKELSARVGLSVHTINRWARAGRIPSYDRPGGAGQGGRSSRRFDLDAVLEVMRAGGRGPPQSPPAAAPGGKRKGQGR
jgi:hypothetical protein